jgi:hypothetical protein
VGKETRDGFTKETEYVDVNIPKNTIVNDRDILFPGLPLWR